MKTVFECRELTKKFGQTPLFQSLNFSVKKGEIFVILGKNGVGKTTLIKILLGMIHATSGEVFFNGQKRPKNFYEKISAVLESVDNIYPFLSGWGNIRYFLGLSGINIKNEQKRVEKLVKRFKLEKHIHQLAGTYSRGMQQKLAIICCLAKNTEVLFLDEPTLGLDFESNQEIMKIVRDLSKKERKTIILTSHQADVLDALSDTVLLLNNGKQIYFGRYTHFLNEHETNLYELSYEKDGAEVKEILEGKENANRKLTEIMEENLEIFHFVQRKKTVEEILLEVYDEK